MFASKLVVGSVQSLQTGSSFFVNQYSDKIFCTVKFDIL